MQHVAVTIRDFQPEDYPAVVEIGNLLYPEHPTTVEEERFEDEHFDTKQYILRRYVAVGPSGSVVASALFYHMPNAYDPHRFGMWIGVHPQWHGKGVGHALYEHLFGQFQVLSAVALRTWTRETMRDSVAWLERRGFRELMRGWESRLEVKSFDFAQFAHYWGPPPGIDIVTLAEELAKDPESIHALYELDCDIAPDMPRIDPFTRRSFEMYRDRVLNSPGSIPDAVFVAKDGDRYVGLTELFRQGALPTTLNTGLTGVRREHRGRGVAFALKLRALDWAKRHGYREVRTFNSTLNAPMLGINVKLGFVKQPVWITFGKDLTWE
ncbi:MAG TPA: GNAT family N-acetyltransferase [Thermoplasmata archaeon]